MLSPPLCVLVMSQLPRKVSARLFLSTGLPIPAHSTLRARVSTTEWTNQVLQNLGAYMVMSWTAAVAVRATES